MSEKYENYIYYAYLIYIIYLAMLFTEIIIGYNNDSTYMYRLLNGVPHILYQTNTKNPIYIKYYPDYKIITINDNKKIIYAFKDHIHIEYIKEYVKFHIIDSDLDDFNKSIPIIKQLDFSDCENDSVEGRLIIVQQNIEKTKLSWKNPFNMIDVNHVNEFYKIDILYHIKQIEIKFDINII